MSPKQHTVVLRKRSHQQTFGIYVGDDIPSGIYIVTIVPNSPAADANIQPGDRILAINGQLVSSMWTDPKAMLSRLASLTSSLTLSMESSNILQSLNGFLVNDFSYTDRQYLSNQNLDADHDIEKYIHSILSNEHAHLKSSSVNPNRYNLTSNHHSHRPYHRHHHRKRRHYASKQTQTMTSDEHIVDPQSLSPYRSIPSMGTSHIMLRNSQLPSKDTLVQQPEQLKPLPNLNNLDFDNNNKASYDRQPVSTMNRSPTLSSRLSSNQMAADHNLPRTDQSNTKVVFLNGDMLREIRIRRSPNFQGLGFHLHYNTLYYMVDCVEPQSPAAATGLLAKDVIIKINNQLTDQMPHSVFVQIVAANQELLLLVQPLTDYARLHPEITEQRRTKAPTVKSDDSSSNYNQKFKDKPKNLLSRTLSRLKSR